MMRFCIVISSLLCSLFLVAQEPATEVRAVWLTTNWQLDWPRQGKNVTEQKKELEQILDVLQEENFNLVLFQVRAQGKVFYHSLIEEKSPYFNSSNEFDPLAFAIEACHRRGMECHAWIPAFPVEQMKLSRRGKLLEKRPDHYKQNGKSWFLDPGRSETRTRMVLIAKEIVTKYDVDGIHLDYIRYTDAKSFKDDDTYRLYGKGKNKAEWRRDNVSRIVSAVYDAVKEEKKWVQVSSSPIGKYKPLKNGDNWTAYETLYQDVERWIKDGKHDLIFPMMYFKENDFFPYVDQWLEVSDDRPVVPGLGAYRLEEKEGNWSRDDIDRQIEYTRKGESAGQAYFRAGQIIDNKKGLKTAVEKHYKYPAKLPALTWLSDTIPSAPVDFRLYKGDDGLVHLDWQVSDSINASYTYNIYFSNQRELNPNKAEGILVANLRERSYTFDPAVGEFGMYYFVTASDRYHNESKSAQSIYFVHSENDY